MALLKSDGMPARPRHAVARLAIVAVVLVVAACAWLFGDPAGARPGGAGGPGSPLRPTPTFGPSVGQRNGAFRIAGSGTQLYPGATVPLVLRITNPQAFRIVVISLTVKVGNASARCAGSNLRASAFAGKLSIPAHESGKATLHLSMHKSALDGCEGAKFPLSFGGLAWEA